ncbi:hypothetical protein EDD15DRAFT_2487456 [Pisolithus albus]|nr:hypothetical protein EDD15DRAFT_2487456 [Pisolithus albus]
MPPVEMPVELSGPLVDSAPEGSPPEESPGMDTGSSVPEATTPRTKSAAGVHSCIFHTPPFDHGDGMEGAGRTTDFGEIVHKVFPRSISKKPDDNEIHRLMDAETEAKQGHGLVKRSSVAPAVIQDIKSLLDALQKNPGCTQCDNDLIYHCNIPASTAIDPIVDVIMVKSNVSPGLLDPKSLHGTGGILFGDMLGWGAQEAITRLLHLLNATASLGALERPIGLPPSLLKKAKEVRLEQGPEAMNILDSKTSENEAARKGVSLLQRFSKVRGKAKNQNSRGGVCR